MFSFKDFQDVSEQRNAHKKIFPLKWSVYMYVVCAEAL